MNWLKQLWTDQPKGLALPEYKSLSNHSGEILTLPIFDKYYISLLQRDGEKAIPCVKIGDKVKAGDIVARPTSNMALHRHAPTSGEITGIIDITETHASAMPTHALELTADGLDTPTQDFPAIDDYTTWAKEDLLKRIFRSGIAGMGGAGFPTEKKLDIQQSVDTLILNGAECEPYITCDDLLMRHHGQEILLGAQIFAYLIGAKRILLGIEDNKPEAIAAMHTANTALQAENRLPCPVSVVSMPTRYPMGSRHQIAHFLMGKKPDIGKRSYQSGFICHNVATAKATFDAVVQGKPLTERLVTFSGDGITGKGVYRTKVGTPIDTVADVVGLSADCQEIIFGGTMMGFSLPKHRDKPLVIKRETTSVLAFSSPAPYQQSPEQSCIRCGHCADVCPMDLLPQQLQFYGRGGDHDKAEANRLFDCIECGLCTYVCPSDIPLVQIFQHSKGDIIAERKKKQDSEHARIRFETRNARIDAEKAERARKSAARRAKMQKTAKAPDSTDKPSTKTDDSNPKQDLIAAALARAQAKKAARTDNTTQKVKSSNVGSDNVGSDNVGSDNVGSDNVGSDNVDSDNVGSDNVGSDNVSSDNVASDNKKYTEKT